MVRKTKKTNKRKYSTGSQRNHSITRNKRMYGGYYDNEVAVNNDEVNNDEVNNDEQAANEILEKIEKQNKLEFPNINEIPFIGRISENFLFSFNFKLSQLICSNQEIKWKFLRILFQIYSNIGIIYESAII